MAYNSDGYIMIDFTEVDFRRTNQTIEGLFDRCQKVIGTNKFVIVINANNKTPLPSTVCITNGQYVIESVLYTFSISSSDNLHITKKTTPEELINDNHITLKTTWSSSKIDSELNTKQDVLTAGDNIIIEDNIISAMGIKSFTYHGNNTAVAEITFPDTPTVILGIVANTAADTHYALPPIPWGLPKAWGMVSYNQTNYPNGIQRYNFGVSFSNNKLTITGAASNTAMNGDRNYTVYYI